MGKNYFDLVMKNSAVARNYIEDEKTLESEDRKVNLPLLGEFHKKYKDSIKNVLKYDWKCPFSEDFNFASTLERSF